MQKTSLREKAKQLRTETYALYLACRDPRVPWYAKALMIFIIGYAISPIDLVPDFIPVLGQIDDLIIVPAGMSIVIRMIPKATMEECRQRAKAEPINTKSRRIVASIIVLIWVLAIYLVLRLIWPSLF